MIHKINLPVEFSFKFKKLKLRNEAYGLIIHSLIKVIQGWFVNKIDKTNERKKDVNSFHKSFGQ